MSAPDDDLVEAVARAINSAAIAVVDAMTTGRELPPLPDATTTTPTLFDETETT